MFLSLRSPFGGAPLRLWGKSIGRGEQNISVASKASERITEESIYCVKIGYYEDGSEVLIKDKDAYQLFKLLEKVYGKRRTIF